MEKNKSPKKTNVKKKTPTKAKENHIPWINPVGGLGDTLILSGVLNQLLKQKPKTRFNLSRRTKYLSILENHPAINEIGNPPKGSKMIRNDYWSMEDMGLDSQRPYQILARSFGLKTPVEEILYYPGKDKINDSFFLDFIPFREKNIIIAPNSDSPRKMMHPMAWHILVEKLTADDCFVMQVGKQEDLFIKGSYSLLGATSPAQLVNLLTKTDVLITTDNFVMHAAHLTQTPTVAIWGPTSHKVYGYPEQRHFQAPLEHCPDKDKCLGPDFPQNYPTQCPLEQEQCINKLSVDEIYFAVKDLV